MDAGETPPYIHGPLLAPTHLAPRGPLSHEYRAAAEVWLAFLTRARFDSGPVQDALASLLQGPIWVPARHAPNSVRVFPAGSASPWHTDNYRDIPAYEHLRALTVDGGQLSWIIPLAPYEGGGIELPDRGVVLRPEPGELLLFDGSRERHRIGPVEGTAARWTLGGFAAAARDGAGWYVWS